MDIKIEKGAKVQITDKQIVNNIVYGDVVQRKEVMLPDQTGFDGNSKQTDNPTGREETSCGSDSELFHFIHPSVYKEQEWKIHNEIKNLVTRYGIKEICNYLIQLRKEKKVFLPESPSAVYQELVRIGMPNGEGYNETTFRKYYRK